MDGPNSLVWNKPNQNSHKSLPSLYAALGGFGSLGRGGLSPRLLLGFWQRWCVLSSQVFVASRARTLQREKPVSQWALRSTLRKPLRSEMAKHKPVPCKAGPERVGRTQQIGGTGCLASRREKSAAVGENWKASSFGYLQARPAKEEQLCSCQQAEWLWDTLRYLHLGAVFKLIKLYPNSNGDQILAFVSEVHFFELTQLILSLCSAEVCAGSVCSSLWSAKTRDGSGRSGEVQRYPWRERSLLSCWSAAGHPRGCWVWRATVRTWPALSWRQWWGTKEQTGLGVGGGTRRWLGAAASVTGLCLPKRPVP